jgi:hypothetical protein
MAGSAARKTAVLRQAADQSTNLLAAKEAQKAPGMLAEQDQAELEAAERLTKLGGATAQIGELALQKLKGAGQGPVQRQVSQAGESELSKAINPVNNPTGHANAKSALVAYANDPAQRETALVTLRNLGIQDPETYLERADQVLNRAVQTSGLTASEMEPVIQQYGFANMGDLATTLGLTPGQMQGMSPTDISNQINARRQELLDRTSQLQSQAGRTGLAGAAGQQQLQAFTQAGGVAREKEAARPTVDMAAKVKVGDTEYDVENILKDEEFSGVIEQWLAAKPEDRAKIIPGDWPLSEWLTSNESSLAAATQAGAAAGLQLSEAQKGLSSVKSAPKLALNTIVPGFDPNKTYSSSEIQNMTQQWADSKFSKAGQAWLGGLSQAEIDQIKGSEYTEQDLKDMEQLSAPGNNIKAFLGIPDKNVYTKDEVANYKAYAALPDDVKTLMNTSKDLYKGLPASELAKFSGNPTLQREYEEWATERNKFSTMPIDTMSPDDLASSLFGGGVSLEQLNQRLTELKDQEGLLGTPYKFAADSDSDGKLSLAELRAHAGNIKSETAKPKSVDSFKTADGFADYKPMAAAIDPNNLGSDPEYTSVRDWVRGDTEPALTDPKQVSLAVKTYSSLPNGPTKEALKAKMVKSVDTVFSSAIRSSSDKAKELSSMSLDNPDAIRAYGKQMEKDFATMNDEYNKYPSDWPGLSDSRLTLLAHKKAATKLLDEKLQELAKRDKDKKAAEVAAAKAKEDADKAKAKKAEISKVHKLVTRR